MRQNFKRRPRTRSAKRVCEEKFCCPFIDSEAKYYCEDCKSAQCQACESSIHKTKVKYDFHERKPIPIVSDSSLCQARKLNLVCQEKNFPDLWCEQCKVQLCFTCYDSYHSSEKRRQHINVSVAHHLKKQQEQLQEQVQPAGVELYESADSTELYHDAVTDTINPQAPFSLADENDSMTFCSFPQESNSGKDQMQFISSNTSFHSDHSNTSIPDVCQGAEVSQTPKKVVNVDNDNVQDGFKSFLLVDEQEVLQVNNEDDFIDKLGCERSDTFKVVSIFGNTGDGKSHTLNHTFFGGHEVFKTSTSQSSCTIGVWGSLSKHQKVVVLDTEGLLGSSSNENQRTRLLLKVLAVSDIVIYRTRAERMHTDMFVFLSNASKAYFKHFKQELQSASKKYGISESDLGPTLIVFHETSHTDVLQDKKDISADGILRQMFKSSDNPVDAFPKLCYVGVKTIKAPTDFSKLQRTITTQIEDTSVRAARRPEIIFQSLKALNDKFNQEIETPQLNTFPDQYFTCTSRCLACKVRCTLSMNHDIETGSHDAGRDKLCEYQSSFGNKVFMCKTCLRNKKRVVVVPKTSSSSDTSWVGLTKYIWSGYVYECPNCGVIYRSREHWYGNEDEEKVLHVEFRHVWPQGPCALDGTHNAARKVLEGFHYVADTVSSVGAGPAKYLAEWTADKINPSYWMSNSEIIKCTSCQLLFDNTEQKHHCRACGKGFCADCSTKKRAVPERGWGSEPVRVCDRCFASPDTEANSSVPAEQIDLTARKVGEAMSSTFSAVVSALDYPIGMIKNSAKPAYWIPDDQITDCCVCQKKFGPRLPIHHCRACGQGVCKECSPNKCTVPLRGWDYPVRVCRKCEKKKEKI